jgi:hypothetical protein
MRVLRLIRDVRFKGETCERRETRNTRESASMSAARTHGGMIDAPGGSNGVGEGGTLGPRKM